MRPLVIGCASSLIPMCQVIYRVFPTPGFHRWERPSIIMTYTSLPASRQFVISHLARVEGLDPSSCGFGDRSSALNYTHIKARQFRVLHNVQVISKLIFSALPSYIQKLATNLHVFASCVQYRLAATVGAAHRSHTISTRSLLSVAPLSCDWLCGITQRRRPLNCTRFNLRHNHNGA